jgi:hypothetical protein
VVLTLSYVDDGLVAARTATDALVDRMVASVFVIRELGEPRDFLGIRIVRELKAGTIALTQVDKVLALAAEPGVAMEGKVIPMSPETLSGLRKAQEGDAMGNKQLYQSAALAQCTRPVIALAVGALAAYSSAPSSDHVEALLGVVRYGGSTAQRGITYWRGSLLPTAGVISAGVGGCKLCSVP